MSVIYEHPKGYKFKPGDVDGMAEWLDDVSVRRPDDIVIDDGKALAKAIIFVTDRSLTSAPKS